MIASVQINANSSQRCEIGFEVAVVVTKDDVGDLTVELCLDGSGCRLVPAPDCRRRARPSAGTRTTTRWNLRVRCDRPGTNQVTLRATATDDDNTKSTSKRITLTC